MRHNSLQGNLKKPHRKISDSDSDYISYMKYGGKYELSYDI